MSDLNLSRRSFGKLAAVAGTGVAVSGHRAFASAAGNQDSEILRKIRSFIPENEEHFDVIVAGGGPSGLGAAFSAAMQGAKTLLVEARSFFGGVAQIGLWMPMNRLYAPGRMTRGGVHDIFLDKLQQYNGKASVHGIDNKYAKDGLDIHPDYLRLVAYEMLEEVGSKYLLYSPVTGVIKDGDKIIGIKTTGKDGIKKFYADVIIDTTGDGDVAYHAGAPYNQGSDSGRMMPVSLSFAIANTDAEKALEYINDVNGRAEFDANIVKARKKGYLTANWYYFDRTTVPGVLSVNNGGPYETWEGFLDGTRVNDLVLVERLGTKIAIDFINWVKEFNVPGLENCYLGRVSPHAGVRETRRITGEYVFTGEDAIKGPEFQDSVLLRFGEHIDGQYFTKEIRTGHQFPYRALVPLKVEGLLVAGRCASFDHEGHAAARSMGNMMAMGQSAGIAAALASKGNILPRKLEVKQIQNVLDKWGVQYR